MIRLAFRRTILAGLGLAALAGLAGCAPASPPAAQAPGAAGARIAGIVVDTAPLLAQSGDPIAAWANQALTAALNQRLAADMGPGQPSAKTLTVRVDSIVLGSGGAGDPDWMRGAATLGGAPVPVRATASYVPMSVDTALWEQAQQGRVQTLSQAFAVAVKRKLGL